MKPFVSQFVGQPRMPCHEVWKGPDLTKRFHDTIAAMAAVIFASLRGTVRIKSVYAMAKIAGTKNGRIHYPS
jgi:hypothetical protein